MLTNMHSIKDINSVENKGTFFLNKFNILIKNYFFIHCNFVLKLRIFFIIFKLNKNSHMIDNQILFSSEWIENKHTFLLIKFSFTFLLVVHVSTQLFFTFYLMISNFFWTISYVFPIFKNIMIVEIFFFK